jgi:hypothetical protein
MGFWEYLVLTVTAIPLAGIFSIPPFLIWTSHRRKMEELKIQKQRMMAEDVRSEFAALRQEIRDLRDTTMQYDLSFDTALQHMERRMAHLERQARVTTDAASPQNVTLGGR